MRGVSGGKNLNALRRANNNMDLPPDVPIYIIIWAVLGVIAAIVSSQIPPER